MASPTKGRFTLTVPLDASEVDDFQPEQGVKVAAVGRDGGCLVRRVKLNKAGKGQATFSFRRQPGHLKIVVGPEDAEDEELLGLQTLQRDVSARLWQESKLTLPELKINTYYWRWWLSWCRIFTIRGRVLCPDGTPVPGAKVTAFDVDRWWWWCSKQFVGGATTDENGFFKFRFRWCCGWWPWYWWRRRHWELVPDLTNVIVPELQKAFPLERIPRPTPKPDLKLFSQLLSEERILAHQPEGQLEPAKLDLIRDALVARLPVTPALQRLHIWPWYRWYPWWDCTPDLIFQVTQNCEGETRVIVDEDCGDARFNVPTDLTVTLVANDEACCIEPDDTPDGECVVLSKVCQTVVDNIHGNPGASAGPAGYTTFDHRPFGGDILISGQFGNLAQADYYKFQISDDGGATFANLPAGSFLGITRRYWGPKVGTADPPDFHTEVFAPAIVDGELVIESREHFEANNDPASWGATRFWVSGRDRLTTWRTAGFFADGTYELRLVAYDETGGNLGNEVILPLCNTEDDNGVILTIDNRLVGAGSGHPAADPNDPCGSGTIHTCTLEPHTDIISVRINGVNVDPCDVIDASAGGTLEVDFAASDPDGHLYFYQLHVHYAENKTRNLLIQPSATLTPLAAAQVGPTYGAALTQGAIAPDWHGGTYRLTITNLAEAFPETCAYQFRLHARKRTIVSCNYNDPHRNTSQYAITVTV